MKDKLRGIWVSDLVVPTGFSRVSHGVLKYLENDLDITGLGINYKGDPHNFKFPIYPAFLGGDLYGLQRLIELLNQHEFDFLFLFNDVWVLNNYLKVIKQYVEPKKVPPIFTYFPVDAEEHSAEWYENFDIVKGAYTYTEFGKKVVEKARPDIKIGVIPHGTDTDIFYKKFEKKSDAKVHVFQDKIKLLGDPKELFIVLNANRNQPRKKLDLTAEGFSLFAKNKPETVKLYFHCGVIDASMNISKLSERYNLDNRLILTSLVRGVQNESVEKLNDIYNACDVGMNTSLGEGWGLTNTEHAVTGAAQVVPDHSACKELFHDCGVLIPANIKVTLDNTMIVGKMVQPDDVANSLEVLYQDRKLLKELGQKSIEKFTNKKFLWETIARKWMKIFEDGINDSSGSMAINNPNKS